MFLPHIRAAQDNPMPGAWIDGAEDDSFRISAGNWDAGLLSAQCPGSPQYRQKTQDRFVFKEQDGVGGQLL